MIIEKIATFSNNDNFFSNNHILTKSFADSQFAKDSRPTGSRPKMPENCYISQYQ